MIKNLLFIPVLLFCSIPAMSQSKPETSAVVKPVEQQLKGYNSRDIDLFNQRLRTKTNLTLDLDFNGDKKVDQRDVTAMSKLCDRARCAITP